MKRIAVAALVAALFPISAFAQTSAAAPQRHLVYSFTWGVSNDTQMHTSGMGSEGMADPGGAGIAGASNSASGMVDYTGGNSDKGTITVDVTREQPDSGLVVSVSEQGQDTRKAPPATCVVYSDTTIVCDPNKRVNAEELTLLRFLGAHFVDPNNLDSKQHWRVEREGAISTTADYTIAKNDNGQLTIDEVRVVNESGARPLRSDVNTTIGYDFNRTVPTTIDEYMIQRSEQGEQYKTIKSQTVLTLQTDSLAKN
jgi:hypothetical protein